jgi:hypothetical protein
MSESAQPAESWFRPVRRFLIATATSALLCLFAWSRVPRSLHGRIDIVGYPTFQNFAFEPSFAAYRLVVYAFPILALALYSVLAWRGPLRRPLRSAPAVPVLLRVEHAPESGARKGLAILRLLLPTVVVALAASSRNMHPNARITVLGVVAGVAYLLVVLGAATMMNRFLGYSLVPRLRGFRPCLAIVNAVAGAFVSFVGLWFVSRHTFVATRDGSSVRYWPWLSWWVAALGLVVVLAWMVRRLRAANSAHDIERGVLAIVVTGVLVFIVLSKLPGQVERFEGFDDAQNLVGAELLLHGSFPWRDFLFIHGIYVDGLRSNVGFAVFQNSIWGSEAGIGVLLAPLSWIALVWLAVWRSRTNLWPVVVVAAFALSGQVGVLDGRDFAVPFALMLLGEAIIRVRWTWSAAFTTFLFAEAVIVPETVFLVAACFITLVAADLVHRDPSRSRWTSFPRTGMSIVAGVALSALWAAYLALNHSLHAFIDYYLIFGPGHAASGAIPPPAFTSRVSSRISTTDYIGFGIGIAVVLLTFWMATWRIRGRHAWTPGAWALVAAALLSAFYGEKAVARFDGGHVQEVLAASMPMLVLAVAEMLLNADRWARAALQRVRTRQAAKRVAPGLRFLAVVRSPVSIIAALAMVVGFPASIQMLRDAPGNEHVRVDSTLIASRVGYASAGAIDADAIADLRTVLDTYAGPNGTVFDMTNSLGYFYYLLGRSAGTRFVHVSMAIPESAQDLLIGELKKSRPPLVALDSANIGFARWDGPEPEVRHFVVAQYVLDGYTPLVRTHGILIMLRRDLAAGAPAMPRLRVAPRTSDLYFAEPACDWGYVGNFLQSTPVGTTVRLMVRDAGRHRVVHLVGWAIDPVTRHPAQRVLVATGSSVRAVLKVGLARTDVAAIFGKSALKSGFVHDVSVPIGAGPVTLFGVGTNGVAHLLGSQALPRGLGAELSMPDGTRLSLGTAGGGWVDGAINSLANLRTVVLPTGIDLDRFQLATFRASSDLGRASLTLSDTSTPPLERQIRADSLPQSRRALSIRVGACLQWHGYRGRSLYLIQSGGAPVTEIDLSGVK